MTYDGGFAGHPSLPICRPASAAEQSSFWGQVTISRLSEALLAIARGSRANRKLCIWRTGS